MKLIDAEGMLQAIVGIWKESYGGEVYNLATFFEDYDEFIANGLVVGGQAAQGQLAGCLHKDRKPYLWLLFQQHLCAAMNHIFQFL